MTTTKTRIITTNTTPSTVSACYIGREATTTTTTNTITRNYNVRDFYGHQVNIFYGHELKTNSERHAIVLPAFADSFKIKSFMSNAKIAKTQAEKAKLHCTTSNYIFDFDFSSSF